MKKALIAMILLILTFALCSCSPMDSIARSPNQAAATAFTPIGTVEPFSLDQIKSLSSATLRYTCIAADDTTGSYEQTITEPESLQTIETLFSQAEQLAPMYDCLFENAALTLTMEDGSQLDFQLAADSCTLFAIGEYQYDFMPIEYRNSDGDRPHNNLIYDLFPKIPKNN